jgi:DNA-binding NtrC family response regulator
MQEAAALKIFLVDDDLFSRAIYEQHFRNMGCTNYRSFSNIVDCVSRFDEHPQIIFMDYRTNPERGLKILSAIKKIIPNAYLIFITGKSGIIESLFSLKYGAFEYIIKDNTYADQLQHVLNRVGEMERLAYKKP